MPQDLNYLSEHDSSGDSDQLAFHRDKINKMRLSDDSVTDHINNNGPVQDKEGWNNDNPYLVTDQ